MRCNEQSDRQMRNTAEDVRWSWHKFFVGLSKLFFSKGPAIWIIATYLVFHVIFNNQTDHIKFTTLIIWGVISLCFFFSEALTDLIKNGKLSVNADLKAGVSLDKNIKSTAGNTEEGK